MATLAESASWDNKEVLLSFSENFSRDEVITWFCKALNRSPEPQDVYSVRNMKYCTLLLIQKGDYFFL